MARCSPAKDLYTLRHFGFGFMDLFCSIEISKDGVYFVARIRLANGVVNEYRNKKLEDLLTELVITLQDEEGE